MNTELSSRMWSMRMMDHFLTPSDSQNFPPQWSMWTNRKYAGNNYYFTTNPESHHFKNVNTEWEASPKERDYMY